MCVSSVFQREELGLVAVASISIAMSLTEASSNVLGHAADLVLAALESGARGGGRVVSVVKIVGGQGTGTVVVVLGVVQGAASRQFTCSQINT